MATTNLPDRLARVVAAAVLAAVVITVFPAAPILASADLDEIGAAEQEMLWFINAEREKRGLRAYLPDSRINGVSAARNASMVRLGYFGHVSPTGADAGDILRARRIRYSSWGEIIGWTTYMPLDPGVEWMVDWWMHSPSHRPLILSRSFNYAGVGIVRDGDRNLYTAVFTTSPDHTPPVASLSSVQAAGASGTPAMPVGWDPMDPMTVADPSNPWADGTAAVVTTAALASLKATPGKASVARRNVLRTGVRLTWWGKDRPLATHTAGLAGFDIQHKRHAGRWTDAILGTLKRFHRFELRPGRHVFRIRAHDRRGNTSRWFTRRVVHVVATGR